MAVAAGPAMAEVCDKGLPIVANPVYWIIALLTVLALWRGGRVLPVIATLLPLIVGAAVVWGYLTEDEVLRGMTESAIREGCALSISTSIVLFLTLAALPFLRFRWRAA